MLEKYCDILLIGTELPGLVTAAFLARRGLSVQVIENDFFADHPQMPDPPCLTNVHSRLLRSILGRLNVPEVTIQGFLHQQSNLQAVFPRHRVDVFGNPLSFAEEIEREFPEQQIELKNFYDGLAKRRHQTDINELFGQFIPYTWSEGRFFNKYVKAHGLDDKNRTFTELTTGHRTLGAFFRALYLIGYQVDCREPFAYHVAEMFNQGDGEIFSVIAGHRQLKRILLERITHHDGHIRQKISPRKLLLRNGVIEGVELSGNTDAVLAKYVIWNSPPARLPDVLPKAWRFRSLKKTCGTLGTFSHWFTARYRLSADFAPVMMQKNVLVIKDPASDLEGANFLYLQIGEPDKQNDITLCANFLLPSPALAEDNVFFMQRFKEIREQLIALMPFSDHELKLVFPLENEQKDQDTLFPLHENDFEVFKHSAELNGVMRQDEPKFSGLFPLHYRTPAPNFFITHPSVFYAFGLEAKLTLGLKITDMIWQESELEKKRAMKAERRIA